MVIATTATNVRWGNNLTDVFDYALHPVRGNNPLLIFRHGGGGYSGWHGEFWDGTSTQFEKLCTYLLSPSRAVHFDIASIETGQYVFSSVPALVPRSQRTLFPDFVTSYQRAVRNVRMLMYEIAGSNPSQVFTMGASFGSYLSLLSMFMQPEWGSGQRNERRKRFDTRGWTSTVSGSILWSTAFPDWRKVASPNGINFTSISINGTAVGDAGDVSNPFQRYRFTADGSDQFVVVTGTGTVAPGTYNISAKDSNNRQLTLATAAGVGTATGYMSTDTTDLQHVRPMLGTKPEPAGADGNIVYAEFDALPRGLKEAMSPLAWIQANQTAFVRPTYFVQNDEQGTGHYPYGNSYEFGANVHDTQVAVTLAQALQAKGKDCTLRLCNRDLSTWNSFLEPQLIYNWMVSRL